MAAKTLLQVLVTMLSLDDAEPFLHCGIDRSDLEENRRR